MNRDSVVDPTTDLDNPVEAIVLLFEYFTWEEVLSVLCVLAAANELPATVVWHLEAATMEVVRGCAPTTR